MTGGAFLKPCRCGGRAGLSHANGLFWAFCCDCGAAGPSGTKAKAETGWNAGTIHNPATADRYLTGLRSAGAI